MESMNCSQARQALWPPEKPRLAGAEVLQARQHVQGCTACESYFAQDRSLLDAYDRASQERAPQDLRERVFDALARERSRSRVEEVETRRRMKKSTTRTDETEDAR